MDKVARFRYYFPNYDQTESDAVDCTLDEVQYLSDLVEHLADRHYEMYNEEFEGVNIPVMISFKGEPFLLHIWECVRSTTHYLSREY
jgi:hypothetical protein